MRHLPQLVQQLRIDWAGKKHGPNWRDPMIAPGSPKKMGIEMVKSCAPARFTIKDQTSACLNMNLGFSRTITVGHVKTCQNIEAPKFRKNRWTSAKFDESWDSMGFPRNICEHI